MNSKMLIRVLVVMVVGLGATVAWGQTRIYPEPHPVPRSYLCFEGHSANEITKKANEAGARGWKLVAAAPVGQRSSVWCLEQLQAARPRPEE